ncbi:MAG: universal stress protein [Thermodesulfobacteriota bacterium]|nr:universal stress protein [Thermodesulfobacteriota bacterium]
MVKHRRKILLAVDGSDQVFEAVRYVSRLFPPNGMEVVLFHVMTKVPESFWDIEKEPAYRQEVAATRAWELQQKKGIQEFMEKARRLFLEQNVPEDAVSIKIQERKVGIARDIIHESQNDYHGVVMGRWGMSMLKDFLCGSIANKLIGRLINVPLCVVGGTPQIGKILVAIDASEGAIRAIDYVGDMVDSSHWEVTLLHAIRDCNTEELYWAEKSMEYVFEEATGHLEKAGFNSNQITTRMITGVLSRAGAIVVEALKEGYGTIVVGRRGLSCVEEFFMGRVSNKVIQMAREIAVWVVT